MNNSERLEHAEELANQHPQWSDDELISSLKTQGLEFGPHDKTALLKTLPLKQLRTYYGPLRVKTAKFVLLNEDQRHSVGTNFMVLQWYIDLLELHTKRELTMNVDAYNGRIHGLGEREGNDAPQLSFQSK